MSAEFYRSGYWIIWLSGFLIICFSSTSLPSIGYILWGASVSSLPYLGLAIYTKKVIRNDKLEPRFKKAKLSGVAGAFISLSAYAVWAFSTSPPNEALSPATLFVQVSIGVILFGFVVGGLVYAGIAKLKKR